MPGITLEQAQAKLDALMSASASDSLSVRYADRHVVDYATRKEMTDEINYWTRVVAQLERTQAGLSKHGFAIADFRNNT